MNNLSLILACSGAGLFLAGYFRFITDENGNVDLNNYRFTGGLFRVAAGMLEGLCDLYAREPSKNARSCLMILAGTLTFASGFLIA